MAMRGKFKLLCGYYEPIKKTVKKRVKDLMRNNKNQIMAKNDETNASIEFDVGLMLFKNC
jgi:hypothetical protein